MKTLLYSFFILILAPCNKPQQTAVTKPTKDLSKIIITCRQTACFGKCPVTTFTINGGTKTMTFVGQLNVERLGRYTKPITDKELSEVVEAFDKANFLGFDKEYLSKTSDFPSVVVTYSYDGELKSVTDRQAGPPALQQLELLLRSMANNLQGWTKEVPVEH